MNIQPQKAIAAITITACFLFPTLGIAQSGSFDITFDVDGIVTTPVGTQNS